MIGGTVPLKRAAAIAYGLGQPPPLSPAGIPILRATNIQRGRIEAEGLIFAAIEDLPLDRAPLLNSGEILVVRSGAYTGDSALVTPEWSGSAPGYDLRVTPEGGTEPRYLAYSLLSAQALDQMVILRSRAAQPHLNADELGGLTLHLPPLIEQVAIADYLDSETARIDALITKKRRLIQLLEERVDSLVFAAVKGLVTSATSATRNTRIEWIGPIPDKWGTPWLGAYHSTQLGKMLNAKAADGPHQRPYLKNTNVKWDQLKLANLPTMTFDADDRSRCALRAGDVLVCEGGEVGRAAVWPGEPDDVYFQKALHRVRPLHDSEPRFLMYCLWTAAKMNVFAVEGNQATIVHLTGEKLREHRFPWPPLAEQVEIVVHIDECRRSSSGTVRRLNRQIDLLVEHRQALITAAVTGEFAVPGAAA